MTQKLILQKNNDPKYGRMIQVMTNKECIGYILSDGSVDFYTKYPVLPEILTQLLIVGSNFDLFYNIQPEARL